jgi:7-cyano-7-deazaguanine synthase in queuosine biosynthesis
MEILTSIDNTQKVEFDLPNKFKKIGINISGGLDSAFLLWFLLKYLKEQNRTDTEIVAITIGQNDYGKKHWNSIVSAQVIDKVLRLYDPDINNDNRGGIQSIITTHFTYYRPSQNVSQSHEMEPKLFKLGLIDIIMAGKTANPPPNFENLLEGRDETRDEGSRNSNEIVYGKRYDPEDEDKKMAWYIPFTNVDKRFIRDQYIKFNLMDTLYPVTRSCEHCLQPDQEWEGPCEECWWCNERYWAFGKY